LKKNLNLTKLLYFFNNSLAPTIDMKSEGITPLIDKFFIKESLIYRLRRQSYLDFFNKANYASRLYFSKDLKRMRGGYPLMYLTGSFSTSQPIFSLASNKLLLKVSITGRRALLSSNVFKKSFKKSFKACKLLFIEIEKFTPSKVSLALRLNKLKLPLRKFLSLFYDFNIGKFKKKSTKLAYVLISPKKSYSLRRQRRLRRVKKRLRKRTLKAFKSIPY